MSSASNDKWDELTEIFGSLRKDFERAVAARAFFEAGNTKDAVNAISASSFVPAAMFVRSSVLESWTLSLSRMFDNNPRNSERYTFARAALLLSEDLSGFSKLNDNREIQKFLDFWAKVDACPRRKRLKGIRDKTVAHALNHIYKQDRADIQDVRKLHIASAHLIESLARGTGLLEISANAPYEVWKDRVARYWAHLQKSEI